MCLQELLLLQLKSHRGIHTTLDNVVLKDLGKLGLVLGEQEHFNCAIGKLRKRFITWCEDGVRTIICKGVCKACGGCCCKQCLETLGLARSDNDVVR